MAAVSYSDLEMAFDFVSSAPPLENRAYVALDTGKIYWVSSSADVDDELPDDLEESERYVPVPHKNDLDLGKRLVLRFMREQLSDEYGRVDGFFRRAGAYARLKDLLAAHGVLDKWYAYEKDATDRALREWCGENGIEILE